MDDVQDLRMATQQSGPCLLINFAARWAATTPSKQGSIRVS
jgi:hypothetical protein